MGDLDPLYIALWKANLPYTQLCKFSFAYWCFYHAGLCCKLSEQAGFFGALLEVVKGGTAYPRGTERRHFRGKLAIESITAIERRFRRVGAEGIVDWIAEAAPIVGKVMGRVEQLPGFGPWISWKAADMLERLGLAKINFTEADLVRMFRSSKQGAEEVCAAARIGSGLVPAYQYLVAKLESLKAPPRYERPINVQEIETILCKWHSHLGGHYPVGKDSRELRLGILRYARYRTSQKLLKGLPVCQR